MTIRGILLAGGASTRFGSQKLLHRLPNGRTIGEQSALNLIEGAGNALAVLRPGSDELKQLLAGTGCEVMETDRAFEGMGASLSAAIAAAADASGWIIALADMPFILPSTIAAVRDALADGAPIAIPVVDGQRGHPVGFAAEWRLELEALTEDEGARHLIARCGDSVREVTVADSYIHKDIDEPLDLSGSA